jgi:nitroreductase
MILAATNMGLGPLWFIWFEPQKLLTILNIPENLEIAAVLPIGKSKGSTKVLPCKDPEIQWDRYTHVDEEKM